jgi:hypothetical protein
MNGAPRSVVVPKSGDEALEPGVGGVDELLGGAVEDDAAFVEDEEFCAGVDAVVGDGLHLAGGGVEAVRGESEGVLDTVGDEERGGL